MRNLADKRRHIVETAATLLAEQGFDGMTLAKVGGAAGAAVGSIVHFFENKAGLAAAVADDLATRLVADAEKAIQGAHGPDVAAAVEALLAAVLDWPRKFPRYQRLIGIIDAFTPLSQQAGIERRLAKVLAVWAEPLKRAGVIAPLSATQLYAVVLAPAIYCPWTTADAEAERQGTRVEWLSLLTAAALAAIVLLSRSGARRCGPVPKHGEGGRKLALCLRAQFDPPAYNLATT